MNKTKSFGIFESPAFPIPPIFSNELYDPFKTKRYVQHLIRGGAKCLMTTAGTSQYNLLDGAELLNFNWDINEFIQPYKDVKLIVGVPPLSTKGAKKFITNTDIGNASPMLLYPDRYYGDQPIVDYFYELADHSKNPCFIHGMFMRSVKGTYNYTADLICKIAEHKNIIGMKEETQSIDAAYEVCKDLPDDFEVIVAGKSQRRFQALLPTKATNFLAGVGSMFPKLDCEVYDAFRRGEQPNLEIEDRLFDLFMDIGWHKAMREAISILLFDGENINRKPFPNCSPVESLKISNLLREINE